MVNLKKALVAFALILIVVAIFNAISIVIVEPLSTPDRVDVPSEKLTGDEDSDYYLIECGDSDDTYDKLKEIGIYTNSFDENDVKGECLSDEYPSSKWDGGSFNESSYSLVDGENSNVSKLPDPYFDEDVLVGNPYFDGYHDVYVDCDGNSETETKAGLGQEGDTEPRSHFADECIYDVGSFNASSYKLYSPSKING